MADERVGTHEAKTHLSEYVNRVRYAGERIVIERHGKPVAALVSTEDLERLAASSGSKETAEERYRRSLEEAGIKVTYPAGERGRKRRRLIKVKGRPVSEQIIAERR
jgi:prevent-host-death family protein